MKMKNLRMLITVVFVFLSSSYANAIIPIYGADWWGSTTFNDDIQIHNGGDVIITANQTITFNGHIFIEPGGKLYVEPGARMIFAAGKFIEIRPTYGSTGVGGSFTINGATIENAGINVLGRNVSNQFIAAQDHKCGKAIFLDATLKACGVKNYRASVEQSGGIIFAKSSDFQNCTVRMKKQMAVRTYDQSYFRLCTFSGGNQGYEMIELDKVDGIKFEGCKFDGTTGTDPTNRISSTVIKARNAGFIMKDYCTGGSGSFFINNGSGWYNTGCGTGTTHRTEFRNYLAIEQGYNNSTRYADAYPIIDAECNDGRLHPLSIDHTYWYGNIYAMKLMGYSMPMIIGNEMEYNKNATPITGGHNYAQLVDVLASPHIVIENNSYKGINGSSGYMGNGKWRYNIGVLACDLGGLENEVYKNDILDATYNFQAIENNRNADGSSGLKYLCNNASEAGSAIIVGPMGLPFYPQPTNSTTGIREDQNQIIASTTYPTFNSFTNCVSALENISGNQLNYYYYSGNSSHTVNTVSSQNVTGIPISTLNSCPTKNWHTDELSLVQYDGSNTSGAAVGSMAYASYMKEKLAYYMFKDSTEYALDSIQLLLEADNDNYYEYKIMLAQSYASENRYDDALSVLADISTIFTLTEEETAAINGLITIYEVAKELYENDDDWSLVNVDLKSSLFDIATDGSRYAKHMAQSLLKTHEGQTYDPIYIFTEAEEERSNPNSVKTIVKSNCEIYPNPAKNNLTIKLDVKIKDNAYLQISDLVGRIVLQQQISKGLNNVTITNIPSGNYIVKVLADDITIKVQKLTKE